MKYIPFFLKPVVFVIFAKKIQNLQTVKTPMTDDFFLSFIIRTVRW